MELNPSWEWRGENWRYNFEDHSSNGHCVIEGGNIIHTMVGVGVSMVDGRRSARAIRCITILYPSLLYCWALTTLLVWCGMIDRWLKHQSKAFLVLVAFIPSIPYIRSVPNWKTYPRLIPSRIVSKHVGSVFIIRVIIRGKNGSGRG